jgi:hypothetical protein
MSDALTALFTDEVLGRLRKYAASSPSAEFRYRVLSLSQLAVNAQNSAEHELYESTRKRWNGWIANAVSVGLFEEPYGAELKSRLTGIDLDGFRSSLAECLTCWALSSQLGLQVLPRPAGRGGHVLEFAVQSSAGEISFEVKSPRLRRATYFEPELEERVLLHPYSAAIAMRAAMRSANRQFAGARQNILVIAIPEIERSSSATTSETWSAALVRAFYGEYPVLTIPSAWSTSHSTKEGNFLKRPGREPRFTRISAVIGLRDSTRPPNLQAAVLHNPCSQKPVDSSLFGDWRQLGEVDGQIRCFGRAADAAERTIFHEPVHNWPSVSER